MTRALLPSILVALAILGGADSARADGEAGVVINWGDGTVTSECVAFEGDGISGDELLSRIGVSVNDFAGLVCSINSVGCTHSGSFESCNCQCRTGSQDCIYWSFFTQPYGESWRYSAVGYRSQVASDGDLQGWQWVSGSAASAPAPPATTFEAVCGDSPGQSPTPVPPVATSTATPTVAAATATATPAVSTATAPAATATAPAATATAPLPASTLSPLLPSPTPPVTLTERLPVSPASVAPTPAPPATGDDPDDGGGSGPLLLFGVVAAVLGAATVGALIWRGRHGG